MSKNVSIKVDSQKVNFRIISEFQKHLPYGQDGTCKFIKYKNTMERIRLLKETKQCVKKSYYFVI